MFVTSVSQLSVATGNIACAAASPATSLHSSVTSNAVGKVVHIGAVVSMIVSSVCRLHLHYRMHQLLSTCWCNCLPPDIMPLLHKLPVPLRCLSHPCHSYQSPQGTSPVLLPVLPHHCTQALHLMLSVR